YTTLFRSRRFDPTARVELFGVRCAGTDAEEELTLVAIDQGIPGRTAIFCFQECALKANQDVVRALFAEGDFLDGSWVRDKVIPYVPVVLILRAKQKTIFNTGLSASPDFFRPVGVHRHHRDSRSDGCPFPIDFVPGFTGVGRLCDDTQS